MRESFAEPRSSYRFDFNSPEWGKCPFATALWGMNDNVGGIFGKFRKKGIFIKSGKVFQTMN